MLTTQAQAAKIEELIAKGKELIKEKTNYGTGSDSTRQWIRARTHHADWPSGEFDMELIMFSGSPVKGYIVVNHGLGTVQVFGLGDKKLKTYRVE